MATEDTASRDLRSFIALALALKPNVALHTSQKRHDGSSLKLDISVSEREKAAELAELEPLMAKYKTVKPYLDGMIISNLSVSNAAHTVEFSPNVNYKLVRVTKDQLETAKEVAHYLDKIHKAHSDKDNRQAQKEYDEFHEYLSEKRSSLIGEFSGIEFTNAVASYGVAPTRADIVSTEALVFVVIKIFVG
jgi:hypothetical protein